MERAIKLADQPRNGEDPLHLLWLTPERVQRNIGFCLVALNQPDSAIKESQNTLASLPGHVVRERGFVLLEYAQALVMKREIPAACDQLMATIRVAKQHSSARLNQSLHATRRRLQPWATNVHVRDLDERLRDLGRTPGPMPGR